ASQGKLLRALESGEVRPVGAEVPARIDVRIIASTRADLRERVAKGAFREDLLYRVEAIAIELPPLRERADEIPALAEQALETAAAERGGARKKLDPGALRALFDYAWPGNVRELLNEVRRAALLADGDVIGRSDLSPRVLGREREVD